MSENNQMAISPITAGIVGAAAGGAIGGTCFKQVDKAYTDPKALLTMEDDKFETVKKAAEKAEGDAKTEFTRLENGRKIVSEAGDALVKEQNTARNEMISAIEKEYGSKKEFKEAIKEETEAVNKNLTTLNDAHKKMGELDVKYDKATGKTTVTTKAGADAEITKARAEVKKERAAARKAIVDKTDDGLGKELKEKKDALAKITDKSSDEYKAAQKEVDKVEIKIANEVSKNDKVVEAKNKFYEARKKVVTDDVITAGKERHTVQDNLKNKMIATAEENLKDVEAKEKGTKLEKLKFKMEGWKATLAKKVEDVKAEKAGKLLEKEGKDGMKDFKLDKIKGFLPKTWVKPAVIGATIAAAAGVALSYIIGEKNPAPKDVA